MHLLIAVSIDHYVQHHRWKQPGNRCRCAQDVDDQVAFARVIARGDRTDIPNDRTTLIEIGRHDEEQASFGVFLRDPLNHRLVDEARDHVPQWRRVRHCIVRNGGKDTALAENVAGARVRVDLLELCVVLPAEESKWRRERTGADACYKTKYRTIATRAPAGKKSGTEGPIVSSARYCEKVVGRQLAVVGSLRSLVGLKANGRHALRVSIRVEPRVRYIDVDLGRHRERNGGGGAVQCSHIRREVRRGQTQPLVEKGEHQTSQSTRSRRDLPASTPPSTPLTVWLAAAAPTLRGPKHGFCCKLRHLNLRQGRSGRTFI